MKRTKIKELLNSKEERKKFLGLKGFGGEPVGSKGGFLLSKLMMGLVWLISRSSLSIP
ncbi:MAG: hypothetical protein CM1200mP16_12490 [Nitrospina sp.]|nr:MAG: hypothetical protein CM1200mP16_12490 [Nitrospina sp.]